MCVRLRNFGIDEMRGIFWLDLKFLASSQGMLRHAAGWLIYTIICGDLKCSFLHFCVNPSMLMARKAIDSSRIFIDGPHDAFIWCVFCCSSCGEFPGLLFDIRIVWLARPQRIFFATKIFYVHQRSQNLCSISKVDFFWLMLSTATECHIMTVPIGAFFL